jgi:hypothetical protein
VSLPDLVLAERRARRCRLAPDEARLLLAHFRGQFDLVPEGGHVWRVTPRAVAGILRTARRRIVVRPRVQAANLPWLMGLRDAMSPGVGPLGGEPVLELAARALAELLDETAAGGLHRAYRERHTAGSTLTGAIDAAAQMRASPERRGLLHGVADDLSAEIPCNQVPVALCRRLASSALLTEAARVRLGASLAAWHEAGEAALSAGLLEALDRQVVPARYGPLLRVCRALLETPGAGEGPALLVSMERVWEGHLERAVRRALAGTELVCEPQRTFTACESECERPGISMRPDLAVMSAGRVALALDAKWKALPAGAVVTDDFYQALAYAAALGCRQAVLVYPGRRRVWDFALAGVTVRVRCVPVMAELERCRRAERRLGSEVRALGHGTA